MGAEAYVSEIVGLTLKSAYQEAVQQAIEEYGSGGYSGTIKESAGVFLAQAQPLLAWEAWRAAEKLIEEDRVQKWESVGAVPIVEPAKTREVIVTVDVAQLDSEGWWMREAIEAGEVARKKMKPGEGIVEITAMPSDKPLPRKSKVSVTVPKAKTVRRFVLEGPYGRAAGTGTYSSQAEARSAALAIADRDEWTGQLTVRGEIVRETGEPLLTVEKRFVKQIKQFRVLVGTPGDAPVTRWAVAGVYSS